MYSSIHDKSVSGRSKSVNWRVFRICLGCFTSKLLAASFAAAGFGLWIIPSDAPSELMILKLAVSVFFILLAAVFYTGGRNLGSDEFHIDTKRREIRHILRGNDGIARLQARYSFADLADVQLDDGVILARDKSGRVVLNRPCHSVDIERSLASAVSLGLIGRA